ncbi:MAG: Zn-ribbon containing protein [archaeon]|nr:Zn-ribbon containing protein [archaeon]
MPNQCVHCGKLYPDGNKEILVGCSCGSRFFYFIKKEYYDKLINQAKGENPENLAKEVDSLISEEPVVIKQQIKQPKVIASEAPKERTKTITEIKQTIDEINKMDKAKMESDVREIIGVSEKEEVPVILDLESIKVIKPGKFEIDVVNLFNKKRPLIYKLEEGKYIIDLASTLELNSEQLENRLKENKNKKTL